MEILATFDDSVGAGSEVTPTAIAGTWQQQMKWAIRDVRTLLHRLKLAEKDGSPASFNVLSDASFPLFAPLPYLQRIRPGAPNDPLLRQILPISEEDDSPANFSTDPLGENSATLQPGLLQKYHGRLLVVATGACAIHCRYCFRRHFPYSETPAVAKLLNQLSDHLQADEQLDEVILSGGDPLTLVDDTLASMIDRIEAASHIKRLRIHTRLPVVIPQRVTDRLCEMLSKSRLQTIVVVHVNHANEIDDPVRSSIQKLKQTGAMLLNQSVLLKGVNDDAQSLIDLSQRLLDIQVLPYYLHQLDRVRGAAHFEVPIERGRQLIESMRASLPGFAVPRYVQEIAGRPNKTVLA